MPTNAKNSTLTELLDRLGDEPWHLRGAVGFRVVVGTTLLCQLTMLIGHFDLTFGAHAIHAFDEFAADFGRGHYSYFALSDREIWPIVGFSLAIAIVLAWLTGITAQRKFAPLTTLLTWWAVHSVHSRCPTLWDGGDNLIEILLLYAIPIDLWRSSQSKTRLATTLHNLGILACIMQICLVYFSAGLAKVPGEYWRNGTAFYYVLASREFGVTGLGPVIWNNRALLALTTWAPLLLQLGFPWIYLCGRAWPRRVAVGLAMAFHLGILISMGLHSFALIMIGAELLLLSDTDYAAIRRVINRGSVSV